MQFDEFDKKVTEAANHHHPAYDERAWTKMEKLLNKHLPQQEDNRRRFIFFLLLFVGLGIIALFITKPGKVNKTIAATNKEVQQIVNNHIKEADEVNPPGKVYEVNKVNKVNTEFKTFTDKPFVFNSQSTDDNINKIVVVPGSDPLITGNKNQELPITLTDQAVANVSSFIPADSANKSTAKEHIPIAGNQLKKEKSKARKNNSFFFTLSTGPDLSFADKDKLGTTKLFAGAGLGYTFNDRVTIRTGLYAGRKIYTASAGSYHPPEDFYTNYPYLEKVAADCKVYEIPLTISYNFSKSAKHSLFATAGVSSYLMKKEIYDYSYKYNLSGPVYNHQLTVDNGNKHFFSALTLSAGYSRTLNKRITVMAEPYIKLPVTGIGYGKVKLNSGGVLFSIGIKPF